MVPARKKLRANTPDRKAWAPLCRGTAHAGTIHDIFTNTNVKLDVVYEGFFHDGECCCCGSQVNSLGPVRKAALGVVQDERHGMAMHKLGFKSGMVPTLEIATHGRQVPSHGGVPMLGKGGE